MPEVASKTQLQVSSNTVIRTIGFERVPVLPLVQPGYSKYGLLATVLQSRWLDIGQVFCAYLWTKMESRFINRQKKGHTHLERTSLVNTVFLWDTVGNPSSQSQ